MAKGARRLLISVNDATLRLGIVLKMAIFLTRGTKLQNCLNLDGFDIFDTLVNEGFFFSVAADFTFVIIASQDTSSFSCHNHKH